MNGKVYVSELSQKSHELFKDLAEEQGFTDEEIQDGLDSKIGDLNDNEYLFGFRHCDNSSCKEFFNEGFMTEDGFTFCSSECAEKIVPSISQADYGDFIFYTDWEPES